MYTEKSIPDIPNPYGYVYVTTNLVTKQHYCGKHKSPQFDTKYLGSGTALKQDVQHYGVNCFKSIPIEWATSAEELHQKNDAAANQPGWETTIQKGRMTTKLTGM